MREYYIHKHDKLINAKFEEKMTAFHMVFFHECLIQQLAEGRTTINANQLGTEYFGYSRGTAKLLKSLKKWTEVEVKIDGEEPITFFNTLRKGEYDGTIEFELNPIVLKYVKISYKTTAP